MSEASSRADALNRSLRRVHWSVLGGIGACALVALGQAPAGPEAEVDRRFTAVAVALAAGSILTRRASARTAAQVVLVLASLLLAGAISLLAVAAVLAGGDRQTALLYLLGSALLAARPPASVTP